jgi:excisionase family DNA binding protein
MQHIGFDSPFYTCIMLIVMKAYLNASEVAKLLRVNRATVTRWLNKGLLKGAIKPDNGHQWRIPLEAYDKFVKGGKP